jgi:MFS family permease
VRGNQVALQPEAITLSHTTSPPLAVSSIIVSMGLIAIGSGLLYAYVPVKLAQEGFAPSVAGIIITATAAGSFLGCLVTTGLVRRVGHARVFAVMAAAIIIGALTLTLGTQPPVWIGARALYGLASSGLFIVAQSWLNDSCENEWRGRVIAVFYMTFIVCIGAGSYLLTFVSLDGTQAPVIAIAFTALAILPVGLTRLRTPPPPEGAPVAMRAVWRISPVGVMGLLAVGGLSTMVQGFAPIYASAEGYTKDQVALLLFLMQFGMIGVQLPLGALSDRIDRRYVLLIAAAIVAAAAMVATRLDVQAVVWVILVFAVWAGATESIFAVANAHANDRADPQFYVTLSSTLIVCWSISGVIIPAVATALTEVAGPKAFMYVALAIAVSFGLFVAWRVTRRTPVPEEEQARYQPISAQLPYTAELAPYVEEE